MRLNSGHKDNSWLVLWTSGWPQTNSWLRAAGMTRSCSGDQARDKDRIHLSIYGLHIIMITGHLRSETIPLLTTTYKARVSWENTYLNTVWHSYHMNHIFWQRAWLAGTREPQIRMQWPIFHTMEVNAGLTWMRCVLGLNIRTIPD